MDPLPFWPMQTWPHNPTHISSHINHISRPNGWPSVETRLTQLKNRFGLVPEVAVQSLVQCESDQGLHHHQQPWSDLPPVIGWVFKTLDADDMLMMLPSGSKWHKRPEKNRDAALHGCCHDVPQCHKKLDKLASHGRGWRAISNIKDSLSRHCVRHDAKERTLSGQW